MAGAAGTAVVREMVLGVPVRGSGRVSVISVGLLIPEVALGAGRGAIRSIMLAMSVPNAGKRSGVASDNHETRVKPGAALSDGPLVPICSPNTSPRAAAVNVIGL